MALLGVVDCADQPVPALTGVLALSFACRCPCEYECVENGELFITTSTTPVRVPTVNVTVNTWLYFNVRGYPVIAGRTLLYLHS